MNKNKPTSPPPSFISPLDGMTSEQMMAMDDAEFFDCLERELENDFCSSSDSEKEFPTQTIGTLEHIEPPIDIKHVEPTENTIHVITQHTTPIDTHREIDQMMNESQPEILPPVNCIQYKHPRGDPEIKTSLGDYPHFPRPPDISNKTWNEIKGLDENELLHYLDEEWEFEKGDPGKEKSEHVKKLSKMEEIINEQPRDPRYTIVKMEQQGPPVDPLTLWPEEVVCLGNCCKPRRKSDIYRALLYKFNTSDFPYTKEQRDSLGNLSFRINQFHDSSTKDADSKVKKEIDLLLDLMSKTDRSVVSQTLINKHIFELIDELEYWTVSEPLLEQLSLFKDSFTVDPAFYIITRLKEHFPESTIENIEAAFYADRKQINVRLAQLFEFSKFPFTDAQRKSITEVASAARASTGNPDAEEDGNLSEYFGKVIYFLNYQDQGERTSGVSNPKKVKKEFNLLVQGLMDLEAQERRLNMQSNFPCIETPYLVGFVKKHLSNHFIPKYMLPQPRAPSDHK